MFTKADRDNIAEALYEVSCIFYNSKILKTEKPNLKIRGLFLFN